VSGAVNSVKRSLSSAWNTAKSLTSRAWNGIRDAVRRAIGSLLGTVRGIPGKVKGSLSGAGSWLYESGKKIIQGLINGIKNMAGGVYDAVQNVLSRARNLLPFSPAKEGPFSGKGWTLYSGRSIGEALADGIADTERLVQSAADGLVSRAHPSTVRLSGGADAVAAAGLSIQSLNVTVPAKDVAEFRTVVDFFERIQQEARARAPR